MPDQKSRRARPADRKRQLIDHAAALFSERGFAQVSMADIATAAGVTAPSLYRHFDDKQALLMSAVMAGVDDLEACTARALENGHDAAELIDALSVLGQKSPRSTSLWRASSYYLTPQQNKQVVMRTRDILHRWAQAIRAERPDLSDRSSVQLAWAMLSISGSLADRRSKVSPLKTREAFRTLVTRLIDLDPTRAPSLAATPPPAGSRPTRRDEILDAAAELFDKSGYTTVGVDDIGAAVGISGPSVYRHFSSKLAILVGIGYRAAARLEAGVMAAYATTADSSKLLALLVDSYVGIITSTPDLSVSFRSSAVVAGQPDAAELLDVQRRYVARWIDLLTDIEPDLPAAEAAISVHAALAIVNDAVQIRRGSSRPDFDAEMAYLMKGVLGI